MPPLITPEMSTTSTNKAVIIAHNVVPTGTVKRMTTHEEWLRNVTNGDSNREIDRRTGINYSALGRKLRNNGKLSAEYVLAIARGYGLSEVQALIDTGHLPPRKVQQETAEEIAARIKRDVRTLAEMAEKKSNIIPLRPRREYDPTQGIPDDAVADNSPNTEGDLDDLDP